jgi:hypothetical protein
MLSLTQKRLALLVAVVGCTGNPPPPAAAPSQTESRAAPAQPAAQLPPAQADPVAPERQQAVAESADPEPAPPPAPATVPAQTTVLHIGDSMAGALGIELNKQLRAAGVRAILRFKTASFIPTWAWGLEVGLYMARYDPDLTLITLGANEIAIEDPTLRKNAIRKLVGKLEGRPCVWIAPPLWSRGDTGLLPVIRDNCAPCVFMDTNRLVKNMPRLKDKIHPTMGARKIWAKFVVDWLAHQRKPDAERPWELFAPDAPNPRGPAPLLDFAKL